MGDTKSKFLLRVTTTRIFRYSLDENVLHPLYNLRSPESLHLRDLNVENQTILFSRPNGTLNVVPWVEDPNLMPVNTEAVNSDDAVREKTMLSSRCLICAQWNGILASRLASPNTIIVFKRQCVEVFQGSRTLQTLLTDVTLREVSISQSSYSEDHIELSFFGFDVLQGIFQYSVHCHLPNVLDVTLLSVHPLTTSVRALDPSLALDYTPERTHGFISTLSLGASGKRAVWVERERGSIAKDLMIWERLTETTTAVQVMEGKSIWKMRSYDLRGELSLQHWAEEFLTIFRGCDTLCFGRSWRKDHTGRSEWGYPSHGIRVRHHSSEGKGRAKFEKTPLKGSDARELIVNGLHFI